MQATGGGEAHATAFEQLGEAVALRDDDLALVPRDAQVDAVGDQAVVGRVGGAEVVVDGAARALDVARDHVAGDVAGHVDRSLPRPPMTRVATPGAVRDVDRVVALQRVDLEHLDVGVGDRRGRRRRSPGR